MDISAISPTRIILVWEKSAKFLRQTIYQSLHLWNPLLTNWWIFMKLSNKASEFNVFTSFSGLWNFTSSKILRYVAVNQGKKSVIKILFNFFKLFQRQAIYNISTILQGQLCAMAYKTNFYCSLFLKFQKDVFNPGFRASGLSSSCSYYSCCSLQLGQFS